jgi:hypothetical protein
MKSILILIFTTLISLQLHAIEREIVVLTSIKNPRTGPFWRSKDFSITQEIENLYRNSFENSGYKLVVKHAADQLTLQKHLLSDKTLALFWVSHSIGEQSVEGLSLSSSIQDYYGNDVRDLFQNVNPNVRFIGLVGCESNDIIKRFREQGHYKENQRLEYFGFDKKVHYKKGIQQSIKQSAKLLDQDPEGFMNAFNKLKRLRSSRRTQRDYVRNEVESIEGLKFLDDLVEKKVEKGIKLEIRNSSPYPLLRVNVGDHFLGILKPHAGIQSFTIPEVEARSSRIKVVVSYDSRDKGDSIVLDLSTPEKESQVDYFKKPDGTILGKSGNIYYLKLSPSP